MCCRSEVDPSNLFDVPILYGAGIFALQRKTINGNLFEVPREFGSDICTFECHEKKGATKRLKSGKIVGIINKQLVKAPIIGCDFHLSNVENTLVLSQLNDEFLQRCEKEVIDDSLLDFPVDVMVEEVAFDFIPNSVMAIPL